MTRPPLGLTARLFLSYLLMLMVTLVVFGLAFLVFLSSRPAAPEPVIEQLVAVASQVPMREVWQQTRLLPAEQRLAAVSASLQQAAEATSIRILLANTVTRAVLWDSTGIYAGGQVVRASFEPFALPASVRLRYDSGGDGAVMVAGYSGVLLDPDGDEWLFIGIETLWSRLINQDIILVYALPRPTQTLRQAFAAFGTDFVPVMFRASLVGLAAAILLAVVISRSIARPLLRVAETAAAVAQGQRTDVPTTGPDEVRAVAEAFNRMSADMRAEQQSQQDFLANVSHDLKTPLTSIQGFSQAIMDGAAPDPVAAARIIHEEASRMNRMVIELTDLARIQAGRLSMNIQPIDLGLLTRAISEKVAIVAAEKGIALTVDAPPMPAIAGDGDRLAQVLTNLISNAIQYTPSGGMIAVRAVQRANGVEVSVQDSGIGIAAADLPRIFERFYQVDKARGPRRGTGLGLAIAHEIVSAHGGTITATSPGEGQGSTFTIWFPSPQMSTVMRRR